MNIFKTKSNIIPYTANKLNGSSCYIPSVSILGVAYQVLLYYKNTKTPTINLNNRIVEVVIPNKYKKINSNEILKILLKKLYDRIAEQEIERVMEKTRLMLGFAPEDYSIQRLPNNKMGMYLADEKKIVINPDIIKYGRNVIEYVVLHEFCHIKYKIHAKGFWKMIKTYMPDYTKYERMVA